MSIDEIKKRGESYDDLYYKSNQCKQKNFRMLSYYDDKSKGEGDDEQNQYTRQIQALNAKFDQVGKFVSLSFRLLFHLEAYNNEECINVLCEYPKIPQLLFSVLLETDNFYIRDQFTDGLCDILCNQNNSLPRFVDLKQKILHVLLFDISQKLGSHPTHSYKYFEILGKLLSTTPVAVLNEMQIDFEQVLDMEIKIIFGKTIEKSSSDYDTIFCGSVKIVRILLQLHPHLKQKYGDKLLGVLLKD